MALHELSFSIEPAGGFTTIPGEWSHTGVVGSGDLEILVKRKDGAGVDVKIMTPISGFDNIWKAVAEKAVIDAGIGGVSITINDNNATPFVVATRLRQCFIEAGIGSV